MAAFDARHCGVLSFGDDASAVRGCECDLKVVRVLFAQTLEAVEKLKSSVDGVFGRNFARRNEARPPLNA